MGSANTKKPTMTVAGFTICSLTPTVTKQGGQFIASTSIIDEAEIVPRKTGAVFQPFSNIGLGCIML
jgi:hypothetical protein